MKGLLASFRRDTRGVAAVEMALVAPLLVALVFGAFEAGNYFWNEHIVIKAVRDGARFAGRQSFSDFSCAAVTNTTTLANIQGVTRTGQTSGGTPRITGWTNGQVTVSVSCPGSASAGIYASNSGNAPRVTVSTTLPYRSLFGSLVFANSLNLAASAQAAVMGI